MDQTLVITTLLLNLRGQPPVKRVRRVTINTNARLIDLYTRLRDNDIDITWKASGHLIRLG